MKQTTKYIVNHFILVVALTTVSIFGCRCATTKANPLAGFRVSDLVNLDSNKKITNDYKDYIQNLLPKEKQYLGPIFYFENDKGEHAVRIETDIGGTDCWYHILFYDQTNKRLKVIKYFYGRYRS